MERILLQCGQAGVYRIYFIYTEVYTAIYWCVLCTDSYTGQPPAPRVYGIYFAPLGTALDTVRQLPDMQASRSSPPCSSPTAAQEHCSRLGSWRREGWPLPRTMEKRSKGSVDDNLFNFISRMQFLEEEKYFAPRSIACCSVDVWIFGLRIRCCSAEASFLLR